MKITALVILFVCFESSAEMPRRSAAEPDYPPFSVVRPDGSADGYAGDLLKAAAEVTGLSVEFKTAPWDQIKQELADGELDVLPLMGRTPERGALYDFTVPYMTLHGALFVRKDESGIRSLADLHDKKIAVMKGDNAAEYVLRSKLSEDVIGTTTFAEAFQMLAAGEADAVIAHKLMGRVEYEAVKTRPLIYGGDQAYPPFEFLDENGEPSGFNIDLARALAKEFGITISFQLLPWKEVRRKAAAGEIDMMSMLYSEGREQNVDYSVPLLASAQAVFARSDSPAYRSLNDLKAYRISVQDGDLAHDFALENGLGENLTVAKGPQEALQLLAEGKVDFSLGAFLQSQYWIKENGWENLRVVERQLYVTDYCFAVPNGRSELLNLINAGLLQLKTSGEYRRIYNECLGPLDPSVKWWKIYKLIRDALLGVVCIGLLVVFWFGLLKWQVRKSTNELRKSEERFNIAADAANIGINYDITERVENEKPFRMLFENMNNCVAIYKPLDDNSDFKFVDMNPAGLNNSKISREEVIGRNVTEVFPGVKEAGVFGALQRVAETGEPQHFPLTHYEDGRIELWVENHIFKLPSGLIVTVYEDVTEKHKAEAALRESADHFRSTINDLQVGVIVHNADSSILLSNLQARQLLGMSEEQLSGKDAANPAWCFVKEDLSVMDVGDYPVSQVISTQKKLSNLTMGIRHPDREEITWVLTSAVPVFTEQNELSRVIVNFIDITDRKQAERNLLDRNNELERFNKAVVGRELRMIELKEEINDLCSKAGEPKRYH